MRALEEAGADVCVLSDGDPEMLSSMVDHAGITGVRLDRGTVPRDEFAGDPDAVASGIREVGPALDVT